MQLQEVVHDVVSSRDATIAFVSARVDGVWYHWEGTAKRAPGDKYDSEIGFKLAMGRAFEAAARQFSKQGNGLVKCYDDNKTQSREAKAKQLKTLTP